MGPPGDKQLPLKYFNESQPNLITRNLDRNPNTPYIQPNSHKLKPLWKSSQLKILQYTTYKAE